MSGSPDAGEVLLGGDDDQPSPRSFGVTFAVVAVVYGLWPLLVRQPVRGWPLVVAAMLGAIATIAPRLLALPSKLWHRLGLALHHVVNPVVMGVLFYLAVTPFGVIMRWRNPDLSRRFALDRAAPTYWITRPGAESSMRRQF